MPKLALLFSGQGAQYPGMGLDFKEAELLLNQIQKQTNINLKDIITTGENLNITANTQLAVFAHSMAAFLTLKSLKPVYAGVSGFSLGEYSALTAADVFDVKTAIDLVHQRSMLMQTACENTEGGMAAVLGLDQSVIADKLANMNTGKMYLANLNSPVQSVISGEKKAMDEAIVRLKEAGAKRVIPLQVSGAFHTPLMDSAKFGLKAYLEQIKLSDPNVDVYLNVDAGIAKKDDLKQKMVDQIVSPVQFVSIIEKMKADGFTHFLELGPSQVLSNLVRKIDVDLDTFSFERYDQIEQLKGWLETNGFIK